jgi:DNA primase small subunit
MSEFITALELLSGKNQAIRQYYENDFNPSALLKVIGAKDFSHREFAYIGQDDRFHRNLSFASIDDLHEFLVEQAPKSVFAGAVYLDPPSRFNPVSRNEWLHRELVFDIDLDLFDPVRSCGCRGSENFCLACWELVITTARFITDTLIADFGLKKSDIHLFFSGRRGIHAWISDHDSSTLDGSCRSAIADYLSLVNNNRVDRLPISPIFRQRLADLIIEPFLVSASHDELLASNISPTNCQRMIKLRNSPAFTTDQLLTIAYGREGKMGKWSVLNGIMKLRYPRFDRKVTTDISHLLRLPRSVHQTGKIVTAVSIDDISTFNPLAVRVIGDKK